MWEKTDKTRHRRYVDNDQLKDMLTSSSRMMTGFTFPERNLSRTPILLDQTYIKLLYTNDTKILEVDKALANTY